jgi:hypothetical protein
MLWVRSQRYANRMVRVGRLLVAFRGQYAEIPDWAAPERDWMVRHLPGVIAADTPAAVFGVEAAPPLAPSAADEAPATVNASAPEVEPDPGDARRARSAARRGR